MTIKLGRAENTADERGAIRPPPFLFIAGCRPPELQSPCLPHFGFVMGSLWVRYGFVFGFVFLMFLCFQWVAGFNPKKEFFFCGFWFHFRYLFASSSYIADGLSRGRACLIDSPNLASVASFLGPGGRIRSTGSCASCSVPWHPLSLTFF